MRQLPHLVRVQRAIGDRHAQHIGVQLQIKPVHQAKRLEFLFRQGPVKAAFNLACELRHAGTDKGFVEV